MHTATGNPSWRVEALLDQWGARALVGVPAGTDLAGAMKDTDTFYRAVLALAGVAAEDAVVVDDSLAHLVRARATGARTILVDPALPATAPGADAVVGGIADVPEALRRLA